MYHLITRSMFHSSFRDANRLNNFSYEGRDALYDYYTDVEDENDKNTWIELDVIAICCNFAEDKIERVLINYSLETLEELKEKTLVLWHDNTNVLYQVF